jgi:hypothetical protein
MKRFPKPALLYHIALVPALVLVAACDGPGIPIPPTPTPGAFQVASAHNHSHGGGGPDAPLFTRYGGDIAVTVETRPQQRQPNTPLSIIYTLQGKDGAPVTPDRLLVTHERLMHLIVVSRDLSYFSHLHPESTVAGSYAVTQTLPATGPYLLFNEFYMAGGKMQLERDVLMTGGAPPVSPDPVLTPTLGVPLEADGLTAVLTANASKIRRRSSTSFQLQVVNNGRPVTDMEPFLGAPAHVVMVSADTRQFAHTHADLPGGAMAGDMGGAIMSGMSMPSPPARFGPTLSFAHTFMQPGLYRLWVQFGYQGKVITVGFNIEVYK